jgi:hypothetical protein
MKNLLFLISAILTLGLCAQNPDKNFDGTWVTNSNYPAPDPAGWLSTNVLTNSFASSTNPVSVTQSTVNCNGGFSMRVETKIFTLGLLTGFLPDTCGFAFTGTVAVSIAGARLIDGFPYNQRPTNITYCYQTTPAIGDTSGVGVLLWKWNGTSRTYIGGGKNAYTNTVSAITNATLNIAYSSTITPDSMCIYVGSSYKFPTSGTSIRKGAKAGSVIWVDNFNYPASTVGVAENTNTVELKAYPNPANTTLYVATESTIAKTIEIIDLTGKVIERIAFNDGRLKLDVSKYNIGLYFYNVIGTSNQNNSQRPLL